ncbi:unnamed protein product [Prunus brigantina]
MPRNWRNCSNQEGGEETNKGISCLLSIFNITQKLVQHLGRSKCGELPPNHQSYFFLCNNHIIKHSEMEFLWESCSVIIIIACSFFSLSVFSLALWDV